MSDMEEDWKNKMMFNQGRYARFHRPTKRWCLFDKDGNNIGSGRNIREIEEVNARVK